MAAKNINKKSDGPSNVDRAGEVFDEYGNFIRLAIRFRVKNEAEAEDLFQDLFVCLVAKPIPEEVRNVKGFLYKLISDTAKDAFRRIDRYQARIHRYAERNLRIVEDRPETCLMGVEETKKMFDLIERRLPAREAWAVMLRYGYNCNTSEVAEEMKVKLSSVRRYVSAGLKKIGHVLGKNEGRRL